MDKVYPFSPTPAEYKEIKQPFKLLLDGIDPSQQEETAEAFYKYANLFDLFFLMVDRRTGSFLNLPFSGGVLNQPSKTMKFLIYLQSLFLSKLNENPSL